MLPPTSPTEPSPFFSEQLAARTASLAADADPLESPFTGADALLRRDLDAAVAELAPSLRDLAVALHGDPETAFEEKRAAQRLADLIAADGLDAQVGVFGRETGVAAEFTAGTGGRTGATKAQCLLGSAGIGSSGIFAPCSIQARSVATSLSFRAAASSSGGIRGRSRPRTASRRSDCSGLPGTTACGRIPALQIMSS